MSKKSALITGGAKRIGRAFAIFLAEKGYSIGLHYRTATNEIDETLKKLEEYGVDCLPIQADLAAAKEQRQIFPLFNKDLGPCSLLINNVSVFNPYSFLETTPEQFDTDIAINVRAPFFLSQDFAQQAPPDSLIVNLLDCRIAHINTSYFVYNLTKHTMERFTMMAAKDLGPLIRVNAIAPGPALPPADKNETHLESLIKNAPLRISSPPATLVNALDYLLQAKTVTGQVLFVDSGFISKKVEKMLFFTISFTKMSFID